MNFDWKEGELAEGLRRYRAGEFFEAHEFWEGVWLQLPEPEKTFLQSIIQITAAFHHLQRNNPEGARGLLRAALGRLEQFPEVFGNLPVDLLRSEIRERLASLSSDHPAAVIPIDIDPLPTSAAQ